MKAVDYFIKYKEKILTSGGIADLIIEMSNEIKEIAIKRSSNDSAVISILKEMNQKWNALCVLLEKEYGKPILVRNGFMSYWKKQIPGL